LAGSDAAAVSIRKLERGYTSSTLRLGRVTYRPALRGIDLDIERGTLFGLLGPNGSGKTTLIKVLSTLLVPSAGAVKVAGFDVVSRAQAVRQRIGLVLGGDRGVYERLSGRDNLRLFAHLYGLDHREQKRRIDEMVDVVGLTADADRRVEGYSRGMRQRLQLARGMLHRPEVLFLDEPTNGIDPVGARELREVVARLRSAGTTILLTTHYMFEADELSDQIAIIYQGLIIARGTPQELKRTDEGLRILDVEAFGVPDDVIARIEALPSVVAVTAGHRGAAQLLEVQTHDHERTEAAIHQLLAGVRIGRVVTRAPNLEDAYVTRLAEAQRQGDAVRNQVSA